MSLRWSQPRRALLLLAALGCVGPWTSSCASGPRQPFAVDYPGELRAPDSLAHDVLWRQRVTAFWREGGRADGAEESRGFDAALQRTGGELTVLGLSPAGSVGFSIVYDGESIELVDRMPEAFPFEPRLILLDVQRAFFPWLPGEPPVEGEVSAEVDGERIVERYSNGRITERRFERLDAPPEGDGPAGEIVVVYDWTGCGPDDDAPSMTALANEWFGYRLEIETLEQQRL